MELPFFWEGTNEIYLPLSPEPHQLGFPTLCQKLAASCFEKKNSGKFSQTVDTGQLIINRSLKFPNSHQVNINADFYASHDIK